MKVDYATDYNITLKGLLNSKFHIGHLASRLHPKMESYVLGIRNKHSIIDIKYTWEHLQIALRFIENIWKNSEHKILFVSINSPGAKYLNKLSEVGAQPVLTKFWLPGSLTSKHKEEQGIRLNLPEFINRIETQSSREGKVCAIFVIDSDANFCRNLYKEANILGLPVISVLNTNSDPTLVSYPIPGNNRSILVFSFLVNILLGILERTRKFR